MQETLSGMPLALDGSSTHVDEDEEATANDEPINSIIIRQEYNSILFNANLAGESYLKLNFLFQRQW